MDILKPEEEELNLLAMEMGFSVPFPVNTKDLNPNDLVLDHPTSEKSAKPSKTYSQLT